ncbi:MAG: 2-heptaprenyl,4-naphthoquinone methyltransferase [Myxococcales bacterium]|nr:2-heptaprenyl,4-naphthoquinone methyltransferase [Myxococcales bacterium]
MSRAVQQMFDGIAPTYDTLNRVLSLGIDQSWRRKAVAALGDIHGRKVLDVCAGTLDLSLIAVDAGAEVIATDFSHAMLAGGRGKVLIPVVRADAQELPFEDASFDGVICGFGLRNLDDARAGLAEMRRLVKRGGRAVVLDFFRPRRTITRAVQSLYNQRVLPFVGGLVSGDGSAYRYLADSIERFASREDIEQLCRDVGFQSARGEDFTLGIASMVVAQS